LDNQSLSFSSVVFYFEEKYDNCEKELSLEREREMKDGGEMLLRSYNEFIMKARIFMSYMFRVRVCISLSDWSLLLKFNHPIRSLKLFFLVVKKSE
jgi:hypothetical protein